MARPLEARATSPMRSALGFSNGDIDVDSGDRARNRTFRSWEEDRDERAYWLRHEFDQLPAHVQRKLRQRVREFDRCQRFISVERCTSCNTTKAGAGTFAGTRRCQMRTLCAHCAWRRAESLTDQVMTLIGTIETAAEHCFQLVTVTLAHNPEKSDELEYAAIRSRIGLALKVGKEVWNHERRRTAVGMVRAVEHGQGANVHLHILILGPVIDDQALSKALSGVSTRVGDIDVRPLDIDASGASASATEVPKSRDTVRRKMRYVVKGRRADAFEEGGPNDLSRDDKLMFAARFELAAHNRRLIERYGKFRGATDEAQPPDPLAGAERGTGGQCKFCSAGHLESVTLTTSDYKAFARARGEGVTRSRRAPPTGGAEDFRYHSVRIVDHGGAGSPFKTVQAARRLTQELTRSASTGWAMTCMAVNFLSCSALWSNRDWRPRGFFHELQAWLACQLIILDQDGEVLFASANLPEDSAGMELDSPITKRPVAAEPEPKTINFGLATVGDSSGPHETFNEALDFAAWAIGDDDPAVGLELLAIVLLCKYEAAGYASPASDPEATTGERSEARRRLDEIRSLVFPAVERVLDVRVLALSRNARRLLCGAEYLPSESGPNMGSRRTKSASSSAASPRRPHGREGRKATSARP